MSTHGTKVLETEEIPRQKHGYVDQFDSRSANFVPKKLTGIFVSIFHIARVTVSKQRDK